MVHPNDIIAALEKELIRNPSSKKEIEAEIVFQRGLPAPTVRSPLNQSVVLADRKAHYLAALAVELRQNKNDSAKIKEIQAEIDRVNGAVPAPVERAVSRSKGVQTADNDNDLKE
jgi:hypothetical protein